MASTPTRSSMDDLKEREIKQHHRNSLPHSEQSTTDVEKSEAGSTTGGPQVGHRVDDDVAPDGGRQAWLSVLSCWCAMFVAFGWLQSVGIFQAHYELNQLSSYSHSEVSWITSLNGFLFFSAGLIVGPLQDSYGPTIPLAIGTVLHTLGLMMTSLSNEYYQLILAQGVCSAFGMAFIFYPALTCVVTWFQVKRAPAVGLAATGAGIGGIIFPVTVIEMLDDAGFGWTMRTCAFLVLAVSVVGTLTATTRFPPGTREKMKPNFGGVFRDVNFLLVTLGAFLTFVGMWTVFTFIVTTAIARSVESSWAFYLTPILNAASVIGRLACGMAALKYGVITMYCVVTFFSLLVVVCIWIPVSGQAGMIAFAVFFGFGSGGMYTVGAAVVAAVSEHDLRNMGLRNGVAFTSMGIACLFGSPLGGAIISSSGYRSMQALSAVALAFGVIVTAVLRWRVAGFDLRKKV